MQICSKCGRDVDAWLTKDGKVRKHSRPVTIPGGISRVHCTGSGLRPNLAPVPTWVLQGSNDA